MGAGSELPVGADVTPATPREWAIAITFYASALDTLHRDYENRELHVSSALTSVAAEIVHAMAEIPTQEELAKMRRPSRPEWLDPSAPWPYVPEHVDGVPEPDYKPQW